MIVSHEHKFIFVKTTKTAGTSIEVALSRYCGPLDIITPISPEDEGLRQEIGGLPPQNYRIGLSSLGASDLWRLLRTGKGRQFRNHSQATFIRRHIGEAVWNTYYKFAVERNPFDKAISRYYWSTTPPRPSIADYLAVAPESHLSNWPIYAINDVIAVDFVARYERLADDLVAVARRIGLQGTLELPRAKGSHREQRAHYSQIIDPASRARLESVCAREIREFGYDWRDA
jgi:hypothetical protein